MYANAESFGLESLEWLLRYICLPFRQHLSTIMMSALMPFLYQRYLIKCLLPLCLREAAVKPVEHNQQGQLVLIITPQPITVAQVKLFPEPSGVKTTLSIILDEFFFYI